MAGNYYLLCELFNKRIFVYAIKSNLTSWHYFEEKDSIINVHSSLVAVIRNQIAFVEDIQEVSVDLNSYQIEKYVTDGNFVFKGKKLRTCEFPKFPNFSSCFGVNVRVYSSKQISN